MASDGNIDLAGLAKRPLARPLRLLSFDGGGVRGLSSLIILRRIMYNVKPTDNLRDITKPCDYFDMICGTSTGGLIAIMLGRLRMGVQETIDAYLLLAMNVFQERTVKILNWVGPLVGRPRFSSDKLEDAIKRIVEIKTKSKDTAMLDTETADCKVFVCAIRTANTELALLRSYRCDEEDSSQPTIWQAARATSAAPTFFPPVSFGNPPAAYVDGAMLHNNPIRVLMREAARVWGPSAEFGCIISIGTGTPPSRKLGSLGHQVLLACAKLATHAENEARNFKADQGGDLHREGKYYRFNVLQGLQAVKLEEWRAFDLMDAATKAYLKDVEAEVQACSERLRRHSRDSANAGHPSKSPSPKRHQNDRLQSHDDADYDHEEVTPEYIDVSRVPSRYFTGRLDVLSSLHDFFSERDNSAPTVAVLVGLGGIGKTQIALRYFECERSSYSIAFLVECNSEEESSAAFVRFAYLIVDEELRRFPQSDSNEVIKKLGFAGLLDQQNKQSMVDNLKRIVKAVKAWLARQKQRFLIIFDNADDPAKENLGEFVPHHGNGDVIITTRDGTTKSFGKPFFIEEMSRKEAVALLARASNLTFDTTELYKTAEKIAETLGFLPLAIDQAGSYLASTGSDMSSFLADYAVKAKKLLSKAPNDGLMGYKHSAFTTWEMSFERLLLISPTSASLLQLLGFAHNQDICESLYNPNNMAEKMGIQMTTSEDRKLNHLGPTLRVSQEDGYSFDEAFSLLSTLCLLRRTGHLNTFYIHPVVHVWIRERLDTSQRDMFARDAMVFVAKALPSLGQGGPKNAWSIHRRLYPHIQACWTNVLAYTSPSEDGKDFDFLRALDVVATSFLNQGHYDIAQDILLRAYTGNKLAHGEDHEDTLDSAVSLASIHDLLSNSSKSEELYRLAVKGFTEALGAGHRKTLTAVHNLAGVLKYRGNSDEAEVLYNQALVGRKQIGEEDSDTLESMDALATLYYATRRAQDAEPLRLFVLKTREKVLGPNDPETLTTALNMGMLYWGLGKNDQALELYDRAYKGRKTLLGSQNPETLNTLAIIAGFYANVGHAVTAESMYREVLSGRQLILGDMHPDTLWTQNSLGAVLFMKDQSPESVHMVEQAYKHLESVLGEDHLDTLWVAHNLAMLYENTGRMAEAEKLHKRAMEGYLADLGPDHINTLYLINDLGDCYSRANKFKEAEEMFRQAFEGKVRCFGFRSPHTLYTASHLASTMRDLGQLKEAEELFKRTLETTLEILGNEHADVCICMMNYADLYVGMERYCEAEKLYESVYNIRRKLQGEEHNNTRHAKDLLLQMRRIIQSPDEVGRASIPSRQAKALPSQFGFRARNDTVQVLF